MEWIDDYTVAVETIGELQTAVGNSGIDYIYLMNDLILANSITIYEGKESLVIDGEYPIGSGIIHSFTDMASNTYENTIGIRYTSNIDITIRNMIIIGRNYFGVPYVAESAWLVRDTSGVSVTYENVEYEGPQITYNRYGTTRYIDCDITIVSSNTSPAEEVGEVCKVEIGGTTNIYHTSTTDAVFWFNNTSGLSYLTVLSGANVNINSVSSYFMFNYLTLVLAPVTYTVQSGASIRLQTSLGISYGSSHTVNSILVDENATFHYIQTSGRNAVASVYLSGFLEVRAGARFYMQSASSTASIINFTSGTGRRITINNPLSFVLYSENYRALVSLATTSFTLSGGQLNTWNSAVTPVESAGGFGDTPSYRWFKRDFLNPVTFTGSFTQTLTQATGNLIPEDEPHPADSNLHLHDIEVISIGDWEVEVNAVVSDGRPISGRTEPNANLIVDYEIEGVEYSIEGRAYEDGSFNIITPGEIPIDTEVDIWSNIPFLIKRITVEVVGLGQLAINAPEQYVFLARPISLNPPILPRSIPEEAVIITDTRVDRTRWELSVSIMEPLKSEEGDILNDAVVFIESEGEEPITLGEEPYVVSIGGGTEEEETRVYWIEAEGILVRVTDPIHSGVRYSAKLIWELRTIE